MNYRQIYARKAECERRIKEVCPQCPNRPGIYVFHRVDEETGLSFCYIGQARSLLERIAKHLQEYDHIALSLKKRGLFDRKENPNGWKVSYMECSLGSLDAAEKEMIKEWANNGWQLFNRTAGGQGDGKVVFDNKKPSKTYREGLAMGYTNARREVAHWFDKHLAVSMKKPTKNAEKALEKFNDFINLEDDKNEM